MKSSIHCFKGFLILTLMILLPNAVEAAVVNVSTAAELQAALTAAQANGENDTINIATGTYNTSNNGSAPFSYTSAEDFSLTLAGEGAGNTVLDGGGSGGTQVMVIHITSTNASLQISGITFQRGDSSTVGGGLDLTSSGGDVEITECEFLNNLTSTGAGGLDAVLSGVGTMTFDKNIFQGNNGNDSFGPGGIYVNSSNGGITFTNNQVTDNTAHGDSTQSFSPGGAYLQPMMGGVNFANNNFENNTSGAGSFSPGAFFLQAFGGESLIQNTTVAHNVSTSTNAFSPGGAYIQTFDASATITGNEFLDNLGGNNNFSPGGAFIQTFDAPAIFSGNSISDNNAGPGDSSPGGMYAYMADGGPLLDSNTFSGNTTQGTSDSPGGLALGVAGGDLVFTNNIFGSNSSANEGGAKISLPDFTMNLINNTFSGNQGGENGGGISLVPGTNATVINLYNDIVFDNSTTATGDDIFIANNSAPSAEINLFNNDFGELCLDAPSTCDFTTLGSHQGGNIQEDPLFIDAAAGDFRLGDGSPAIDSGDDAAPDLPATDHDGNPRPFGSAPDMGALEKGGSGGGCSLNPETHGPFFGGWFWISALLGSLICFRFTSSGSAGKTSHEMSPGKTC